MRSFKPSDYQPPLPQDSLIAETSPDPEAVPMDVVFVGGGPAGLAGAIELKKLVADKPELRDIEVGVLGREAIQADRRRRVGPVRRMRMAVEKARQHHLAVEVDDLGVRPDMRFYPSVVANIGARGPGRGAGGRDPGAARRQAG